MRQFRAGHASLICHRHNGQPGRRCDDPGHPGYQRIRRKPE